MVFKLFDLSQYERCAMAFNCSFHLLLLKVKMSIFTYVYNLSYFCGYFSDLFVEILYILERLYISL